MGFYQEGAPEPNPTLVTRLVRPEYDERQCTYWFPETFANQTYPAPDVDTTNQEYKGWFVKVDRLFFANGRRKSLYTPLNRHTYNSLRTGDPWKEATLAADGTNFQSTPDQPLALSDGFHCSDLGTVNAVDPTILEVQQQALKSIAGWLEEYRPSRR